MLQCIKTTIAETASEYESDEVDEVLMWEMLKLKIRDVSMKYSKVKALAASQSVYVLSSMMSCLKSLKKNKQSSF